MRLPVPALALLCVTVASCSSELKSPTESPPIKLVTSVDLSHAGPVPLYTSHANAINDAGVVVGSAALDSSSPSRAVLWRPPGYGAEFLPDQNDPGGSSANAIGRDGVVGGQIGCGASGGTSCRPVYWRDGVLHILDGIGQVNGVCPCDSHTLVGRVLVDGALHGALWIDGVLIDVGVPEHFSNAQLLAVAHGFIVGSGIDATTPDLTPGGGYRWSPSSGWTPLMGFGGASSVFDVNSHGTAVGGAVFGAQWLNGANTPTFIEGGYPTAINDSSIVAGVYQPPNHPFPVVGFWTEAAGWTPLNDYPYSVVTDINNSNQVVGYDRGSDFDNAHVGEDFAMLWQQ